METMQLSSIDARELERVLFTLQSHYLATMPEGTTPRERDRIATGCLEIAELLKQAEK